jgi:hypothetical protein
VTLREWMMVASTSLMLISLVSAIVWVFQGDWIRAWSDLIICATNIIILITWFAKF